MTTTLDCHTVPSKSADDDEPASPGLVEDFLGIASEFFFRHHVVGLHAVGQGGVQSFDLDGIAAAQRPEVVEDATAFVGYGVSDQYR